MKLYIKSIMMYIRCQFFASCGFDAKLIETDGIKRRAPDIISFEVVKDVFNKHRLDNPTQRLDTKVKFNGPGDWEAGWA